MRLIAAGFSVLSLLGLGLFNAHTFKQNARWISENLKDYGAQYVQIDDGWQGTGRVYTRDWTNVSEKFPSGMGKLANYIKSLGLTPGIWIAPHGQSNDAVVKNLPAIFLMKPDGTSASESWEGRYLVDPSLSESQKYMKDLFTKLAGWGYEYFKIDGQPVVVNEYRINLNWKDLDLPENTPIHVYDFWNNEYLGAWERGMTFNLSPTSCRVLTLIPSPEKVQLISTSRHITQGWVDLVALNSNTANTFTGKSNVVKNDPYELRFVFPRGRNFKIKTFKRLIGIGPSQYRTSVRAPKR
jgi:hypothetical protein